MTNSHSRQFFFLLIQPAPNLFFARTRYSLYDLIKSGTRGFNLHHDFFCKIYIILTYIRTQIIPSILLSPHSTLCIGTYIFISQIDFSLSLYLFYFFWFVILEIYCISNWLQFVSICFSRYDLHFFLRSSLIKLYTTCVFGIVSLLSLVDQMDFEISWLYLWTVSCASASLEWSISIILSDQGQRSRFSPSQ